MGTHTKLAASSNEAQSGRKCAQIMAKCANVAKISPGVVLVIVAHGSQQTDLCSVTLIPSKFDALRRSRSRTSETPSNSRWRSQRPPVVTRGSG